MSKAPPTRSGVVQVGVAAAAASAAPTPLPHRALRGMMPLGPTSPGSPKSAKLLQPPATHSVPMTPQAMHHLQHMPQMSLQFHPPPGPLDYVDDYYLEDEEYEEYIGDYDYQAGLSSAEKVKHKPPCEDRRPRDAHEGCSRRRGAPAAFAPEDYHSAECYYSHQPPQPPTVATSPEGANLSPLSQPIYRKRAVNVPAQANFEEHYYMQQLPGRKNPSEGYQCLPSPQVKSRPPQLRIVSQPPQIHPPQLQQQQQQQQPRKRMVQTMPTQYIPSGPTNAQRSVDTDISQEFVYQTGGDNNTSLDGAVRREPASLRRSRFVRRAPTSHLFKRPSSLCLPLTIQHDQVHRPGSQPVGGGILRKIKRLTNANCMQQQDQHEEPVYPLNQGDNSDSAGAVYPHAPEEVYEPPPQSPVGRKVVRSPTNAATTTTQHQEQQTVTTAIVMSDNEILNAANAKSRLDAILDRYDRMFRRDPEPGKPPEYTHPRPKTPPCIKEARQRETAQQTQVVTKGQLPEMMKSADTLGVEEISRDMLDQLLAELTENGLNDITDENGKRKIVETVRNKLRIPAPVESERSECEPGPSSTLSEPPKELPKSMNYSEIKETLSKSKESKEDYAESEVSAKTLRQDASSKKSEVSTSQSSAKIVPKFIMEDVVELHRTKSFVVNLIDTALSNHFGTNVCNRSKRTCSKSSSSKVPFNAKSAVEMLKKHSSVSASKICSSDLAEEIAHAMNETLNTRSRHSHLSSKGTSICSCKSTRVEPLFVRHLRQMRWGHLKHIQHEVKQLEELERFLDSCNISTFDKCHFH